MPGQIAAFPMLRQQTQLAHVRSGPSAPSSPGEKCNRFAPKRPASFFEKPRKHRTMATRNLPRPAFMRSARDCSKPVRQGPIVVVPRRLRVFGRAGDLEKIKQTLMRAPRAMPRFASVRKGCHATRQT